MSIEGGFTIKQNEVETSAIFACNGTPSKYHMLNMCIYAGAHLYIYPGKGYQHFSAISLYIGKIFVRLCGVHVSMMFQ